MAIVSINPVTPISNGAAVVFTPASDLDGFSFINTPGTYIILQNTHSASITFNAETPLTVDGTAVSSKSIVVPASSMVACRFSVSVYNNSVNLARISFASFGTGAATNARILVLNV